MKKIFLTLILISACKGGGGAASTESCGSPREFAMIPEQFHDSYELTVDECSIEIRNLDNGCIKRGSFERNPWNTNAELSVTEEENCTDSYPDQATCRFYTNASDQTFLGCMLLGIDAYFTEVE